MESDFINEQNYLRAKKRVKAIKDFYVHLTVYVIINIFISCVILYGLTRSGDDYTDALSNFGVYSTWIFWGIGIFFHWLGVFGFKSLGLGKDWEEKKIKELMEKDDSRTRKF